VNASDLAEAVGDLACIESMGKLIGAAGGGIPTRDQLRDGELCKHGAQAPNSVHRSLRRTTVGGTEITPPLPTCSIRFRLRPLNNGVASTVMRPYTFPPPRVSVGHVQAASGHLNQSVIVAFDCMCACTWSRSHANAASSVVLICALYAAWL
jgi:hypothetical protein